MSKHDQFSAPVKASVWFTVSNILIRGISFLTLPVFSRILSTDEYGMLSVYQSWVSIFTIFCTLTIWGGVFNVVIVKHLEELSKIVSSFQGLATTITGLFFIVSLVLINPVSNILGMSPFLIVCMYLDIFAQIPFALWSGIQRYFYKYRLLVTISVILAVLNPLLGYLAVTHSIHRTEAKIGANLLLNLGLGLFLFFLNQVKGKTYYSRQYWKYGFLFNIVLVPHYISLQILSQSDRLMINKICGSSDAGIYSVAYTFAMLLGVFTSAINSSFTPWLYKNIRERKYTNISKITNAIVLAVAILSLGLICVIPDVFRWMLPKAYYPAIWVIPPVVVASFFMFLYPLFGAVEFYYEENQYITIASIAGAIINILLNYIFIHIFGFIAAAYTTLLCYILFSVAHYFFMKKVLKKNAITSKIYDIRYLFFISLGVIILMTVITILYSNTVLRWIFIFIILFIALYNRKNVLKMINILRTTQ